MAGPLVSVIMTTYNHAPYVSKAIEGVLNQETNFDYELIIGEDCSTDGTKEIVKNYYEEHSETIRLFLNAKNIGGKQNVMITERACQGKYLAYCEGDDYWHNPKKLQKQIDYLRSHPECGLVFSDYDCFFAKNRKIIKNYRRTNRKLRNIPSQKNELLIKMLHGKLGIQTCTLCLRKNLMDILLNSEDYLNEIEKFPFGDTLRWANLSRLADLHCIDESLATYTILPESLSQSQNELKQTRTHIIQNRICIHLAKKYNLPEPEIRYFMNNLKRQELKIAFWERNVEKIQELKEEIQEPRLKDQVFYWGTKFYFLNWIVRKYQRIKHSHFRSKY